jgi:hypothetical protein
MAHTFEELKAKTLIELRDIAKDIDHEAVQGWSQMNKDHLLPALCKALHIDTHVHHHVVGIDKSTIKAKLRQLKGERDKALEAHDHARLHAIRRQMHTLKRRIHAATV